MPRGRPPKKAKLPPHVLVKSGGEWYVRRYFPTFEQYEDGRKVYVQTVRRCIPHTEERARQVYDEIGRLRDIETELENRADTVETYIDKFLEAKAGTVAVRTLEGYRHQFDSYIKGTLFGRSPLDTATPLNVQNHYARLQQQGVSEKMIRKAHTLLSMAFARAVLWEKLKKNPCSRGNIMLPKTDDPEIDFYDREEARKFMRVCLSDPKYFVLALALDSAMRPGEYLGLRWKDVDLRNNRVRVRQAVSFLRGGAFVIKGPKTKKSKRTIDLTPGIVEELARQRERVHREMADAELRAKEPLSVNHHNSRTGVRYQERKTRRALAREYLKNIEKYDLVFPSKMGTPLAASNIGKRDMAEVAQKAGIKKITLYGLRHTWATLALEAGASIKAVAERLGDSEITVLKHYAHVLPSMRQQTVDVMTKTLY